MVSVGIQVLNQPTDNKDREMFLRFIMMNKKIQYILLVLCMSTLLHAQDSKNVDLNTLNADQLAKVPVATLQQGIQQLTTQNEQDSKLCKQLVTFNAAMCERLNKLNSQCITQAFLITPSKDPYSCSSSAPAATSITVVAKNVKGYYFRLRANKNYISDAFTEGGGTVTFRRDDGAILTPPRFREITAITLVSVSPNSTITSNGYINSTQTIAPADLSYLVSNMQLRIMVNNTSIIDNPEKQWLILQAPTDTTVKTELVVDPQDILSMGKNANCVVSPSELDKVRTDIEASADSARIGDCP